MTITFDDSDSATVMCGLEEAGSIIEEQRVLKVLQMVKTSLCDQFYDEVVYTINHLEAKT